MSSTVGSPPFTGAEPTAAPAVSLLRLYTLRLCYFILAAGIGIYYWPTILQHSSEFAAASGIQYALLGGLGLTAILGFRYPVQMLPLLLFELIWKTVYLAAFALPAWSRHQITASMAGDIGAVVMVVVFLPLIPWRYVIAHYIVKPGERWR